MRHVHLAEPVSNVSAMCNSVSHRNQIFMIQNLCYNSTLLLPIFTGWKLHFATAVEFRPTYPTSTFPVHAIFSVELFGFRQIGKFFYIPVTAGTVDPGIPHDFGLSSSRQRLLLGAPKLLLQNFKLATMNRKLPLSARLLGEFGPKLKGKTPTDELKMLREGRMGWMEYHGIPINP